MPGVKPTRDPGTIRFGCTACGKCCHGLKLPLGVAEAAAWARRGGDVQILSEAIPWPDEPAAEDAPARYRRERSFEAASGGLRLRIVVHLVASFDGACPNLRPDMLCGIYDERPATCRIYPAELNPFVALDRSAKICPPEAWSEDRAPLVDHGRIVDPETRTLVEHARERAVADVAAKARACALLGIDIAALANEGVVIARPDRDRLARVLEQAMSKDEEPPPTGWRIVTDNATTAALIEDAGGVACPPGEDFSYRNWAAVTERVSRVIDRMERVKGIEPSS